MSNKATFTLTNLFIPASGNVQAINVEGPFSNVEETIDWRQFTIDSFPFNPQGVFLDNVAGTQNLEVVISPIQWKIVCKPGEQRACNFPSPQGSSVSIKGDPNNASARVVFVNFPVFPDSWRV